MTAESSEARCRVLVVEDVTSAREALVRMLESFGYEPTAVATLGEAQPHMSPREWLKNPFDVLLLDLKLPDGDSIPLVEAASELNPWPVVVVVTAFLDAAYALALSRLGALYAPKPFSTEELGEMMRIVEERRHDYPVRYGRIHGLSGRETEAVRHALKGLSHGAAARAMGVSVTTIKTLWHRIFRKTGFSTHQKVISDLIEHWSRERRAR